MARSPKDDPRYNEMQHNKWNYCAEPAENCAPGALNDRNQPPVTSSPNILPDNMYANANFGNDVYLNKHPFTVPSGEAAVNMDDKIPFNNVPRPSQNYGNAMLKLGNGQVVRVFIDENHLLFPMSGQYELFNPNQGVLDSPLQASQQSRLFPNQEYSTNNNVHMPPSATQNSSFQDNMNAQPQRPPSSNFLNELLGNLEPTSTGTYSPFGQNYPLNHPDLTNLNLLQNSSVHEVKNLPMKAENSPKRNENSPLADTSTKKRIVAEVKPMRPSYSDVLAKNTKNTQQAEVTRKAKPQNIETKLTNKVNSKPDKLASNTKHDDHKHKNDKKQSNTISSGSESGDINTDDNEKRQKPGKKSKNKRSNMSRKWSSLDDITNEEDSYIQDSGSQFVFIENQDKPKKEKKPECKSKNSSKSILLEDDDKFDEEDNNSFYQESLDPGKSKKKKDARGYHKTAKPVPDKKKTNQTKVRRNKPGYLGMAQNYLEHWGGASWKALVWFFYLLSDICGMSLHLSFDL